MFKSSTKPKPNLVSLPPTKGWAKYYSFGVYHQVPKWLGNQLPLIWWKANNNLRPLNIYLFFKSVSKKLIGNIWQTKWNISNAKLREVITDINPNIYPELNRSEEIKITWLRLGPTRLTHSFIFEKTDPPLCDTCNKTMTVKHLIIECVKYSDQRKRCNIGQSLKDALNKQSLENMKNIISFLKNCYLYDRIRLVSLNPPL